MHTAAALCINDSVCVSFTQIEIQVHLELLIEHVHGSGLR